MAAGLDQDSMAVLLNSIDDTDILNSLPPGYTVSEYISEQVSNSLDEMLNEFGSLSNFLNAQLGLSIPDYGACPSGDELPSISDFMGQGDQRDWGEGDGNTEADLDFFSQTIAGLGLDGPGIALPSPSALEMIKNVNAGVDLYNGSQSASIPLYSIEAYDISIPIALNTSNNGLKVNDIGSLVGQHWNLNAGGMVSRVVKGLPDEFEGTTHGVGVGRTFKITPRFEFPSNVGLNISYPPINPPLEPLCNVTGGILNGFSSQVGPVACSWTPIRPNLVNFSVYIPMFTLFGLTVNLEIGFNAGWSLNEKLGNIEYEEEGLGFLHLDDAEKMEDFGELPPITLPLHYTLLDEEKLSVLKNVHSNKAIEDAKFLVDQVANWDSWIQAIDEIINGAYTYRSKKLDTEPDEFYFNAGDYSGKFSFNVDGQPVMFPIKTSIFVLPGPLRRPGPYFRIYDNHSGGMRYTFGDSSSLYGWILTRDTNYYLPNFYTYPEVGEDRKYSGRRK
ncbi:MAG: hypothetical protein IPG32_17605 [Saprospirales bacterium]|nr:hypothetical protein [Saprospirales bacterium]